MSIKDQLRVFPQDKLVHYQWASWFAALAAIAVMLLAWSILRRPSGALLCALGAAASMATAVVLGVLGEISDARANAAAEAAGIIPPHEVSNKDAFASMVGCIPSAVPLLLIAFLLHSWG